MQKFARIGVVWLLSGMMYMFLEAHWRGSVHVSMFYVGGLCGLILGGANQIPAFYKKKMVWQCAIGAVIILAVEFVAGCVLNIWMGLGVWDYTNMPLNVLGQVCLPYGVLWFFLVPLAIWWEDRLRWRLWNEGKPYTLVSLYVELLQGK